MNNIYETILSNLLPADILKNFIPVSMTEKQYGVELRMEERETNLPIELNTRLLSEIINADESYKNSAKLCKIFSTDKYINHITSFLLH